MKSDGFKTYIPLKERQNVKDRGDYTVVDKDGVVHDEVSGLVMPPKHYDGREFCKIYKAGVIQMCDLSTPALKVLLYFMSCMWYTSSISFDIEKCMEFTQYKNKSYIYKALSELKKKYMIEKIRNLEYRLNPNMFYKGNTMKLIGKNKKL